MAQRRQAMGPAVKALSEQASMAAVAYNASHLAATLAVNPADYPYIRITVPALGANISIDVTFGAK